MPPATATAWPTTIQHISGPNLANRPRAVLCNHPVKYQISCFKLGNLEFARGASAFLGRPNSLGICHGFRELEETAGVLSLAGIQWLHVFMETPVIRNEGERHKLER